MIERSLRQWRNSVAVVDGARSETYADLDERSARLANAALAHGASAAAPVAAYLPSRLEYIEADVACARAGIVRVGIGERLTAGEAAYILADSAAAVLVTTKELFEPLAELLPDSLRRVLLVDGTARRGSRGTYEDELAAASASLSVMPATPDSPNYILYTSGTTGHPKGATHSQTARVESMLNMLACELRLHPRAGMVHAAPLTHGSGSKVIAFIAAGARNIILPSFDIDAFAAAITEEGGTHTFLVPTMLQRLSDADETIRRGIAKLEQISFGGAPISPGLFRHAIESFGAILTQVYGSCEAPHPVTILTSEDSAAATDHVLSSAGRAAAGVDIRTVDSDDTDVKVGEVGELLVRSAHLMSGYWNNPEATNSVFTADGWYRSGDLASIDDDGYVSFRDRKRDLIISGGLNIYPTEVERVISAHPAVHQVAVVGAPDDEWGESVVAYIVASDSALTADDVVGWSRRHLASYKKPRRVEFVDSLPVGPSNKVLKKVLRDQLWADHDRQVN